MWYTDSRITMNCLSIHISQTWSKSGLFCLLHGEWFEKSVGQYSWRMFCPRVRRGCFIGNGKCAGWDEQVTLDFCYFLVTARLEQTNVHVVIFLVAALFFIRFSVPNNLVQSTLHRLDSSLTRQTVLDLPQIVNCVAEIRRVGRKNVSSNTFCIFMQLKNVYTQFFFFILRLHKCARLCSLRLYTNCSSEV